MAVNFFIKDGLKVDPSMLQLLQNSANIPMAGKPFYGVLSDAVYIGEQHRIPYIAIGGYPSIRDPAKWDEIADVVTALSIPVIANGDAFQYSDIKRIKSNTDGRNLIGIAATGSGSWLNKFSMHCVWRTGIPSKRDDKEDIDTALEDYYRIEHILGHLYAVKEARNQGVNVKGFFIWALMDNMEMGSGYNVRFGLNYVDYLDNLKRYPKQSAKWLRNFLKGRKNLYR